MIIKLWFKKPHVIHVSRPCCLMFTDILLMLNYDVKIGGSSGAFYCHGDNETSINVVQMTSKAPCHLDVFCCLGWSKGHSSKMNTDRFETNTNKARTCKFHILIQILHFSRQIQFFYKDFGKSI
jgi:hypothetical protein